MDLEASLLWQQGVFPGNLEEVPLEPGCGVRVAVSDLGGELLATTLNFNEVDTGLHSEDEGADIRSEIFTVGRVSSEVAVSALQQVSAKLAAFNQKLLGMVPAQPGTMIPGLELEGCSVRHGVFVVPYVWGEQVPRFSEGGRLVVMLQLVLLSDEEYEYAVTYGVPALQQALSEQGVDLLDWQR
ncbi:suppressor of fused domain protein [Corynebacterium pelargi]|uniref:Suppressor of fused protein (SUFU) n=1 Tax=Corynebacterium pelargi TaxID=1471400 RepID=A0A410WBK7_9CORY|nr:suppressor of fused domain protein [Corynebacterium pelargi]QAU53341.1 Suppressor of fused protein (SUFU) [Corynebacterium pelargi]GGG73138.1 hypothetical protein GCM10007338_07930 [Corynebacterium pelargi]